MADSKSTTEWAVVAGYSEIQMIKYALTQSKGSTGCQDAPSHLGKGAGRACADRKCDVLIPLSHPDQSCCEARAGAELASSA